MLILLLTFLSVNASLAQDPHIQIVPMSPLLKSELGLGAEYFVSTGLQNVGKGEHVYLRAVDRAGGEITSKTWSFEQLPVGSNAEIVPVVQDIYYFVADIVGQYRVKLEITTGSGTASTERIISANTYTGAGGVGGVSMQFPQCGLCHSAIRDKWLTSDHATIFQRGIDGQVPGFSPARQRTSTTGVADVDLESGSYFSLKAQVGWEFPTVLQPGNFQQLVDDHPNLAQVATVGCESCHGAGSLHTTQVGNKDLMRVSYTSESCMSCHDATRPSAEFHSFRRSGHIQPVWSASFQNRPPTNDLNFCARCHDGKAYVYFIKDRPFDTSPSVFNAQTLVGITCEACHDPHAGGLRKAPASSDTLASGLAYDASKFGTGATCLDCHKYRRDGMFAVYNIPIVVPGPPWGPHYGGAANMMLGDGGYHFYTDMPKSQAHLEIENTCAGCHMTTATGDLRNLMGDHSWKMSTTVNDTRYDLVESCQSCHGPITSFRDIMGADYNMTGVVEPFVDEVKGLMDMLAKALPPIGEPTVSPGLIDNNDPQQKGAYWNYLFVRYDRSYGIHNPKYTIALLQRSITALTGVEFEHTPEVPRDYVLYQNYPNPFNPTTQIRFSLPEQTDVVLEIYDITGRRVSSLLNETLHAGTYTVTWDATNYMGQTVSSGVYIYRLQAGSFVETKRMVFVK